MSSDRVMQNLIVSCKMESSYRSEADFDFCFIQLDNIRQKILISIMTFYRQNKSPVIQRILCLIPNNK